MTAPVSELLKKARQFEQFGQPETAARLYEQILATGPTDALPWFNAGVFALRQGKAQVAMERLNKAIEIDPARPEFHNILGVSLAHGGDPKAAGECFRRAIDLDPGYAAAHGNLANSYREQRRWREAIESYRNALSASPQNPDACIGLADLLRRQGELGEALQVYERAIALKPDDAEIKIDLGLTLNGLSLFEGAASILADVVNRQPDNVRARVNLGIALVRLGRFDEAIANYHRVIELEPESAAAYNNLGLALKLKSDVAGAIECFRKTLALRPSHVQAHSNVLLAMNYLPEYCQKDIYQEASRFDAAHARPLLDGPPAFANSADPERIIRVGYLSPDFRSHSVAHFTRKLLAAHDRDQVEVFGYANVARQDAITADMKAQADAWLSIVGMEDEAVVERIRVDRIDVLVDLAGHTADNRLLVFAHRAAPVQVNWLGYPNTTGMAAMDYRLTDAVADPPGPDDRLYAETLVRLPGGFLCYQNDDPNPPVAPPPLLASGRVTFGSFNNLPKIRPGVIVVWSNLLRALPESRLVLKSWALEDPHTRQHFLQMFHEQGIAAERIDMRGRTPSREEHLRMYGDIDIGLDPFPYNGATTTCEALWMGIPVVTLLGDCHAGRVGASILQHAGFPELVAESTDAYVELARSLAGDPTRLELLRGELRPSLRRSSLMDVGRFAAALEDAYRDMWANWCRRDR